MWHAWLLNVIISEVIQISVRLHFKNLLYSGQACIFVCGACQAFECNRNSEVIQISVQFHFKNLPSIYYCEYCVSFRMFFVTELIGIVSDFKIKEEYSYQIAELQP